MLHLVEALARIYEIMYSGGYFLSQEELDELQANLARLGRHYQFLQMVALRENKQLWRTTTKLHYVVAHLHAQAQVINPRYVQGYSSDSLVGEICGLYAASQHGPFARTIQWTCMLKYCTGLKLLWAR